jgi:hypothetical protein
VKAKTTNCAMENRNFIVHLVLCFKLAKTIPLIVVFLLF